MLRKRFKLVLSGSGTKYPVFVGALKRLCEHIEQLRKQGIDAGIDEVCGTSGGAVIAAGLATHYNEKDLKVTMKALEELVLNTLPGPLLDLNFFPFGLNGAFKGNKILKKFREVLPDVFTKTKIPVRIVTFNNNLGEHKIWETSDKVELPLVVRASMSLPFIFDPVFIRGDVHTDGGVTANFPLDIYGVGDDVIGFRIGSGKLERRKIENKIDIITSHVNGMIECSTREHVEDAIHAKVCYLKTSHGGLDLNMDREDVKQQMVDGYKTFDSWLTRGN